MGLFSFLKKDKSKDHARALFDYLNKISADVLLIADLLRKEWALENSQWFDVLFEYLYLVLNLTDRYAFINLSNEKRSKVMSELAELSISSTVDAVCHRLSAAAIARVKENRLHNYKVSLNQWGHYKKLYPEENEKIGDTVFWEFSKCIANLVGHNNDFEYINGALVGATGLYKDLDAVAFIEKMK